MTCIDLPRTGSRISADTQSGTAPRTWSGTAPGTRWCTAPRTWSDTPGQACSCRTSAAAPAWWCTWAQGHRNAAGWRCPWRRLRPAKSERKKNWSPIMLVAAAVAPWRAIFLPRTERPATSCCFFYGPRPDESVVPALLFTERHGRTHFIPGGVPSEPGG